MSTQNGWNHQIAAAKSAIELNSGTNAINISTDAAATTISIGTGGAVKGVTLGSTNTSSATTINSGSGGIIMTGVASVAVANKNYVTINTTTGALGSDAGGGGGGSNYAFLMNQPTPDNAVTGNGTYYYLGTVTPMTIVYDFGSACVGTGGTNGGATFTAPATGIYQFNIQVSLYNCAINTGVEINLIGTFSAFTGVVSTQINRPATTINADASIGILLQMNMGEYISVRTAGYGELTDIDGIWIDTYISGYKIA